MPPVVRHFAERLDDLGWVTDLLVAGSLATGDYVPGVSDLDLVAVTGGPVGPARQEMLAGLQRVLDQGGGPTAGACSKRGPTNRWSSGACRRLRGPSSSGTVSPSWAARRPLCCRR